MSTENLLMVTVMRTTIALIFFGHDLSHMHTENPSIARAHGCDHAQVFCAHGLIYAHRKSRIIGVRMAMCTSKPIIGKDASGMTG